MVTVEILYEGELHCRATHGPSQDVIPTDAPLDNQGRGEAFSPTDLVGTAMGTCILTIMGIAARERGLDMEGATASVVKHMVADPVRRIGRPHSNAGHARVEHSAVLCRQRLLVVKPDAVLLALRVIHVVEALGCGGCVEVGGRRISEGRLQVKHLPVPALLMPAPDPNPHQPRDGETGDRRSS